MKLALRIATLGPIGYIPYIPGTAASLVGAGLAWYLNNFLNWQFLLLIIVVLTGIAIVTAESSEKIFLVKDDSRIVIDELVGMLLAGFGIKNWRWLILAFFLFRVFDVSKILAIKKFQKLPGGLGVVTDDVIAGLYSRFLLLLLSDGKFIRIT